MFSRFVPRQSSRHLLLPYMSAAFIALAGAALVTLYGVDDEPVTTWSQPGLTAEPNIIWSAANAGEARGLTGYEISTDSSRELQAPIRFVF